MSSETLLVFIVVFGTAATGCSVVVLKTWLQQRRLPRVAGGWATACTVVLFISLIAAAPEHSAARWASEYPVERYGTAEYIVPEQLRVDSMHWQFAPALELYRQTHGVYPSALEDAGIATPMTQYGPLYYYYSSRSKLDPWYLISFGDIETHRFSSDWDSRSQRWSVVEFD
ncbi:MAG TPA: hypothetical protein VF006_07410 [Longimicrobium sp.]